MYIYLILSKNTQRNNQKSLITPSATNLLILTCHVPTRNYEIHFTRQLSFFSQNLRRCRCFIFHQPRDRERWRCGAEAYWFSLQLNLCSHQWIISTSACLQTRKLTLHILFLFEKLFSFHFSWSFLWGCCSLSAPSYQMIPLETDLNRIPLFTNFPEIFRPGRRYNVKYTISGVLFSPHYQVFSKTSLHLTIWWKFYDWIEHEPLILIVF